MHEKHLLGFLDLVSEPNRSKCLQLFNDNRERFEAAPGSKVKHQAWPGGYIGHLEETMRIACVLFESLQTEIRPLPFALSDAILILFLHDLEKPFKYIEPKTHFKDDAAKKEFIHKLLDQYGISLTPDQENALTYIHGEGNDHNSNQRIQGPLAAFVHSCDNMSARIWFDYPKK